MKRRTQLFFETEEWDLIMWHKDDKFCKTDEKGIVKVVDNETKEYRKKNVLNTHRSPTSLKRADKQSMSSKHRTPHPSEKQTQCVKMGVAKTHSGVEGFWK